VSRKSAPPSVRYSERGFTARLDWFDGRRATMAPLAPTLQAPLEGALAGIVKEAKATARARSSGPDEVDWIENFHALVEAKLAGHMRAAVRGQHLSLSFRVDTALVHGQPFQVRPSWRYGEVPTVEIGDVLVVGEQHDKTEKLIERQGLLLQMKVGQPALRQYPKEGSTRQAALFAEWPPFAWDHKSTSAGLPPPFPRTPAPRPCDAAQFGIIPTRPGGTFDALSLRPPRGSTRPVFARTRPLVAEIARVIRLDLGVDATPDGSNGWPRIVQDMLDVAARKRFRYTARTPSVSRATQRHRAGGAWRRRFVVVVVALGPPGVFD